MNTFSVRSFLYFDIKDIFKCVTAMFTKLLVHYVVFTDTLSRCAALGESSPVFCCCTIRCVDSTPIIYQKDKMLTLTKQILILTVIDFSTASVGLSFSNL